MGEEKKKEKKKEVVEEEGKKKEEKKGEEIMLKVDMHCEACARKVVRALRRFEGVEEVTADSKASKVVVKGKAADPQKLCQRIQKKTGRKAEIISPIPKPPPQPENKPQENETPKQETKEEPPAVVTVVLKVRMHCEACATVLQKRIGKIKGVESVAADIGKDQILVQGVVDAEKLVNEVYKRTGKHVAVVKDEEKKEEKKEDEKKEEKLDDNKKVTDNTKEEDDNKNDAKKMEHWPTKYYMDHAYYAPQFFSDENPNACSVM